MQGAVRLLPGLRGPMEMVLRPGHQQLPRWCFGPGSAAAAVAASLLPFWGVRPRPFSLRRHFPGEESRRWGLVTPRSSVLVLDR